MIEKNSQTGLKSDLKRLTKSVDRLKEQNLEGEAKTLVDTIAQSLSSISKSIESAARDEDKTGGSDGTRRQETNQPNSLNPTFGTQGAKDSDEGVKRSYSDPDNQRPGSKKR